MTYTGLELFMENLNQVISCKNNPLINNHPAILRERPQMQLLYEELSSMIQILFVEKQDDLLEHQQIRILKKRFKDLIEDAHNTVGLFVYAINFKSKHTSSRYDTHTSSRYDLIKYIMSCRSRSTTDTRLSNYKCSLNLKNAIRSVKTMKKELNAILDSLKMDSSLKINHLKTQPASVATSSCTKNSVGMKKVVEEMVVGLDPYAKLILDQLTQDQKQLKVVAIVGMGGLGKTTLANKVFNDRYVLYHFHIRVWVTVSQTYVKRDLLIQILSFMDVQRDFANASDFQLREKVHKCLMGQRYLIVIDDIWNNEAWDELKVFFPNDYTGSRIMITSRHKEVALHATSHGFVHHLEYLTDEDSWNLLCKKVFHGDDCPEWLVKPGMLIAKKCHGLPLAVVVIAGVLANESVSKDSWERIGRSVSSYIVGDESRSADMLALSYDHLPPHLKDCFLYLGGFPEDHKFRVTRLIWLWMAEGFIQASGNRSLEEIGEEYLMELVDRNLVVVADRKFNGAIKTCSVQLAVLKKKKKKKTCSVHDLLRELCMEKAKNEHFCLKIHDPISISFYPRHCKLRRIFTNFYFGVNDQYNQPCQSLQSLLCLYGRLPFHIPYTNISDWYFHSYPLLMVLDLQNFRLIDFPKSIELLVFLRYLAFWYDGCFPSSICNLWNLQILIIRSFQSFSLPQTISNLVNLRHLWSYEDMKFKSFEKPMNLRTISSMVLTDAPKCLIKYIPGIKKLTLTACVVTAEAGLDFEQLTSLETLKLSTIAYIQNFKNQLRFPASLKNLSLKSCNLPWSDMAIIQSLPNLEVLKILKNAFMGLRWETGEKQFRQLKFLKLQGLEIQQWEASSMNFPCLEQLVVDRCVDLEEIPLEIGDIPTLKLIQVNLPSKSVVESLDRIREEQHNVGNYDLNINIFPQKHPEVRSS